MKAYEKLLEPITIGTHQWRNRMVKAPSSAMSWDPGQFCNERIIGLYDAISKGGASAIILGGMICDDPATLIDDADGGVYTVETYPLGGLYDDKFIPGLSQLADAVHGNGCELIAQIFQNGAAIKTKGGAWCSSTLTADELPSPEPYCNPTRGLSLEEIEAFKERYFAAAERAKKAGLDGIEVHAANGYFLLSFVSRVWNHRDDQYGCQSVENRTRLVCEIIRGVKERCGEDFIVGVRTNGQEYGHPDAITIEEGVEIAKKTFNPRLGIEGGISVLGTSGIVEPMSEQALTQTIFMEMKMLRDEGHRYCYLTPGNYGNDFLRQTLGYDPREACG